MLVKFYHFHYPLISGFILLVRVTLICILIQDCDCGQLCASCNDVERPSNCYRHVPCRDDEQCYNRRYINATGTALYDLGCIASHACPLHTQVFVGKRSGGPHFKCLSCCNDTLCNQMTDCDHAPPPDSQAVCASCSRTTRPQNCVQNETCSPNEDCYLHKYSTGPGSTFYDLGCISSDLCRSELPHVSGKRSDDHHLHCLLCCNNGGMCNKNLKCSDEKPKPHVNPVYPLPRDCGELNLTNPLNGSYTIYPTGITNDSVSVYCEFDRDGSWTIIQRRFNGSVDFYRNWAEYKNGFGNSLGEYWIGNDIIHQLTIHDTYTLKIILTDWNNTITYAEYSIFVVADESDGYRLGIGGYSGTADDSMYYHNGLKFSTRDRDNDGHHDDCVNYCGKGAWWHSDCCQSSLNGIYSEHVVRYFYGILWMTHGNWYSSFSETKMMLKRQ